MSPDGDPEARRRVSLAVRAGEAVTDPADAPAAVELARLLVEKFVLGRPTHRIAAALAHDGLDLAEHDIEYLAVATDIESVPRLPGAERGTFGSAGPRPTPSPR